MVSECDKLVYFLVLYIGLLFLFCVYFSDLGLEGFWYVGVYILLILCVFLIRLFLIKNLYWYKLIDVRD